ncbi:MAG TPA: peptide MFS transporter [Candidatus Polarisedimenticolia bacterium]|jgi:POT family proton-dependent oligopeptide transporter|nr:peptide MFS transporter [Candidatus Polarisedimenticolia bacterium]
MTAGRDDAGWAGHPRGLSTLFFTEMWERFSYYGMRAFLILYMTTEVVKGGLGFDVAHAGSVYGTYTGSIWLATIGGGIVADRLLGAYRSVMWGGIIIALGHFTLAFRQVPFFYAGLSLIVMGTGLLKPNATTMLGTLYSPEDERRDAGFSIFYMGINLGAFIGPIIAGWLAQTVDWHAGFACAGVGMLIGVIQYVLGKERLRPAWAGAPGGPPARSIGFVAPERGPESVGAAARAGEPAAASPARFTRAEWMRMLAVCVFFVFAALFWGAYEQAASTLALFADQKVDRVLLGWTIPSSWNVSIQAMFVILLSPVAAWVWMRLGRREPSTPMKFSFGLLLVGVSFVVLLPAAILAMGSGTLVSPLWLVAAYFIQVCGELCLSPVGNSVVTKLAPARVVGMMMGVWFLSIAAGNKLAGYAASLSATIPLTQIFGAIAGVTIVASIILMLLTPSIRRMMGGVR